MTLNIEKFLTEKLYWAMKSCNSEEVYHLYRLYFNHTEFLKKVKGKYDVELRKKVNEDYVEYCIEKAKELRK